MSLTIDTSIIRNPIIPALDGISLLDGISDFGYSYIDFNSAYTSLPPFLTALGAAYSRNSLKHVRQGGVLLQLAANQFGTDQDWLDGLYDYVPEPAATNLLRNSGLTGGVTAPTNWSRVIATGTSEPVTSTYNPYAVAYSQSAVEERPFIQHLTTVSANTTYVLQIYVESVTGGLVAKDCINFSGQPTGSTVTFPPCEANPAGGGLNVITPGLLICQLDVAATAGTVNCRAGIGCPTTATGTIRFSSPQFESGTRPSSWILTPVGGTATRSADVLTIPLANIAGFTSATYTMLVNCRQDVSAIAANRYFIAVSDGTSNNFSAISNLGGTDNNFRDDVVTSGATQGALALGSIPQTRSKVAVSYTTNSRLTSVSGVAGPSDLTVTMPTVTQLHIGHLNGSLQGNIRIRQGFLIIKNITQAQLNSLTTL